MTAAALLAPVLTIILIAGACVLVMLIARSLIRYSASLRNKDGKSKQDREIDKIALHDL